MSDIPSLEGALLKVKQLKLPEEDGDISAAEEVLQTLRGIRKLTSDPKSLVLHRVLSPVANTFFSILLIEIL